MSGRAWLILLVVVALFVGGAVALRKLSETETARLAKLRPEVRTAYEGLRHYMAAQGIQLYLVSTVRTADEQAEKIEAGRSTTMNSFHRLGRALDFNVAIKDPKTGKVRADNKGENEADLKRVHAAAPRFGFKGIPNGSPWKPDGSRAYLSNGAWDVFHLEFTEGMTFAQAAKKDGAVLA